MKINKLRKRRKRLRDAKKKISLTQTTVSIGVVGVHGRRLAARNAGQSSGDYDSLKVVQDPVNNNKVKINLKIAKITGRSRKFDNFGKLFEIRR